MVRQWARVLERPNRLVLDATNREQAGLKVGVLEHSFAGAAHVLEVGVVSIFLRGTPIVAEVADKFETAN